MKIETEKTVTITLTGREADALKCALLNFYHMPREDIVNHVKFDLDTVIQTAKTLRDAL